MRHFESGANRNNDVSKPDYEGCLSPLVLERYAQYMLSHTALEDGTIRDSDNWQKGMPLPAYMKSMWRHFMDTWGKHRRWQTQPHPNITSAQSEKLEVALCGVIFNASGYLHELMKAKKSGVT